MHAPPARPRRRSWRPPAGVGLAALLVLVCLGLVPGPAAGAAHTIHPSATTRTGRAAATGTVEPLQVVLTSLSPSVVPTSGPLVVQGRVHNTSQDDWRTVNVSAVTSESPMTTAAELADAAAEPTDAFIGNRLNTPGSFVAVGDLGPGDSTTFRLAIPRAALKIPDTAGVYWFGVQALATNDDGRGVEGRARTFVPVVRAPQTSATVSLVVPYRQEVRRTLDSRIDDADDLRGLLAGNGRLGRVLRFTESSGTTPVTMLVDPAVLTAAQTLGQGNPATRTTDGSTAGASAGPSASADPSPGSGAGTGNDPAPDAGAGPSDPASTTARDWLSRVQTQARRNRVLGLGYADPDTAALAAGLPSLLATATSQARTAFGRLGIDAQPTTAPANGLLPLSATDRLDPGTLVLLSSAARRPAQGSGQDPGNGSADDERAVTAPGLPIVLADPASAGGDPSTSALAVRQRIVAEAALRAQAGVTAPMVVSLPAAWDPGPDWRAADFFGGLQRPWLDVSPLDTSATGATTDTLAYPAAAARAELGDSQLAAIRSLSSASRLYAETLRRPGTTLSQLQHLVLIAGSYHQRLDPTAPARTRALADGLTTRLSGIKVIGNDFVTLSGGSGSIMVTLVNDLDQTTRVGLSARTASDLRITSPDVTTLLPGQRTTVPLRATSDNDGVRAVVVTPVTPEGRAVGTPLRFSVRSSQVSLLIWGVMAAAGVLLFTMIVRRAVRRGLHREPPGA